jgi:type I restriction enzyme, S subunit
MKTDPANASATLDDRRHAYSERLRSKLQPGWRVQNIGDICSIRTGKLDVNQADEDGNYPFFTCAEKIYRINTWAFDSEAILVAGNGFFNVKHYKGKFNAYQRTYVLSDLKIFGKFLYYYIDYRLHDITGESRGSTISYIRLGDLRDYPIAVAPAAQQAQIVEEIEKELSRLDEAVALLKRTKGNLKRYKAAVLKAAIEGKLTQDWRKTHTDVEPASKLLDRILAERRAKWMGRGKYKEPIAPNASALSSLPERWTWATVEQLSEIGSGNTPKGIEDHLSAEGEVPWFKVGDMNRPGNEHVLRDGESWLSRSTAKKLGLRVFPSGTVVFPKRGGAIATNKKRKLQGDACLDLNVMALTGIVDMSAYLFMWFSSIDLAALSDGSNVPQINHKNIAPLLVPLPPIHEQEEIIAEVERRLSVIDELEATIEANLIRSDRLRQSILGQMFFGQKAETGNFHTKETA